MFIVFDPDMNQLLTTEVFDTKEEAQEFADQVNDAIVMEVTADAQRIKVLKSGIKKWKEKYEKLLKAKQADEEPKGSIGYD